MDPASAILVFPSEEQLSSGDGGEEVRESASDRGIDQGR
jgi:hypothetical protein